MCAKPQNRRLRGNSFGNSTTDVPADTCFGSAVFGLSRFQRSAGAVGKWCSAVEAPSVTQRRRWSPVRVHGPLGHRAIRYRMRCAAGGTPQFASSCQRRTCGNGHDDSERSPAECLHRREDALQGNGARSRGSQHWSAAAEGSAAAAGMRVYSDAICLPTSGRRFWSVNRWSAGKSGLGDTPSGRRNRSSDPVGRSGRLSPVRAVAM